jgi:hypothetical protein
MSRPTGYESISSIAMIETLSNILLYMLNEKALYGIIGEFIQGSPIDCVFSNFGCISFKLFNTYYITETGRFMGGIYITRQLIRQLLLNNFVDKQIDKFPQSETAYSTHNIKFSHKGTLRTGYSIEISFDGINLGNIITTNGNDRELNRNITYDRFLDV